MSEETEVLIDLLGGGNIFNKYFLARVRNKMLVRGGGNKDYPFGDIMKIILILLLLVSSSAIFAIQPSSGGYAKLSFFERYTNKINFSGADILCINPNDDAGVAIDSEKKEAWVISNYSKSLGAKLLVKYFSSKSVKIKYVIEGELDFTKVVIDLTPGEYRGDATAGIGHRGSYNKIPRCVQR